LATQTGAFPLYEVDHGKYSLTKEIRKRKPIEEYLKLQGRFRHLQKEAIADVQKLVDEEYNRLLHLVKVTNE